MQVLGGSDRRPDPRRLLAAGRPARGATTGRLGLRLALARHEIEASWGVCNLEIPSSQVCQTEGFLWFACHLLAQLPRFQEIHNQALAQYRGLYGIRSKNHPVAALAVAGRLARAPFWVWRRGQPRRRPLLVRQGPRTMLFGSPEKTTR